MQLWCAAGSISTLNPAAMASAWLEVLRCVLGRGGLFVTLVCLRRVRALVGRHKLSDTAHVGYALVTAHEAGDLC